jgi:EAL domain-containing protein (putative c-di-GMP-specific phosphodiesterase class I)
MIPATTIAPCDSKRVLIVEDEIALSRLYREVLLAAGFEIETAADGASALESIRRNDYDVVLSDIAMPVMDGLELLARVREHDAALPVLLLTANPTLETAVAAVDRHAHRYLTKPVAFETLVRAVDAAIAERRALRRCGCPRVIEPGAEASFARALDGLWLAYQPIVSWSEQRVFAHEVLLRSSEPGLTRPDELLAVAERLGRLDSVGRAVRRRVAAGAGAHTFFVNLHPLDLTDEDLFAPGAPLSRLARHVVLELTERAALDVVPDLQARIARLRALGFRIAVDDLGAGYSGLSSLVELEPEIVKADMSLVRNVDKEPLKRRLIASLVELCRETGSRLVAEGIETVAERDTLLELGCDLLQGYLLGRPMRTLSRLSLR